MSILIAAFASIVLSVAGQFALKAGMGSARAAGTSSGLWAYANLGLLLGFALYVAGAVVWLRVLSSWDVSKAYPLTGIGFVLTLAVGFVLGERVTLERLVGVLLVALGVVLISRS
jgi:multidrug transporter EmrE-like cation transporter